MQAVSTKRDALVYRIDEVLVALRRVIRATDLHSRHLAKTTGLTSPQILLLQTIRDQGQVTIGQLATDISLSQATVTSILDRLEKRGLVYRERSCTDKRKVHAHLTNAGMEVLKHAPVPLQEQFTREFGELEEWEQAMIISSLQRIAGMMDKGQLSASSVLDIGILEDCPADPAEDHRQRQAVGE
ncbi:MarR family winged helix-turn-helix transcriptional regulator [Kineobactrum salinum]|uniref:MarR family transcriptional regulator n=1 Tax=Kineobactrum salinum TaxID=2708301 RepID=A0A6C0TXE8_9GAMM|nr:MarR family transcriptional regulator [Kineobactrum salinum]QIB64510.1 MarR family transcriptional regulator [Kineobactrum salinum]